MQRKLLSLCIPAAVAVMLSAVHPATLHGQKPSHGSPTIPVLWDDAAMAALELPTAIAAATPRHAPASFYYKIPVRPIYKQYPIYAPGREPQGYMDWLKLQEPVILWQEGGARPRLKTASDWRKAGELVFDAAIFTDVDAGVFILSDVRSAEWFKKSGIALTSDGKLPFMSYVIREKGKVELGSFSCGMCHTRLFPGGGVVKGAQGNFPFAAASALEPRLPPPVYRTLFGVPWLTPDPIDRWFNLRPDEQAAIWRSMPAGVIPRHQASIFQPVQVPDLIGVKNRRYLDRTGLQQHRSPVDLMRYAALNQGADFLSNFNGFIPADVPSFKALPDPSDPIRVGGRYSDEQLYAMALYLYALEPPANPNRFNAEAARGKRIFGSEGCARCHAAPLYTSNKLIATEGFVVPEEHRRKYEVSAGSIGTDSELTLTTRRGTGYYKVPSLRGVWYRSMFGHSGWCATLEDWFDPKRLEGNYVPTGYKPAGSKAYPVLGHEFGLDLSPKEKKELIAFLKTL